MSRPRKVIIIGAGIGGLATAIQLARAGMKVQIYEKNETAGGRCGVIRREGHIFDTGPTMYIFPELYQHFFSSIGEDLEDYARLLPADPIYSLHFNDGTKLVTTQNKKKMRHQLNNWEENGYNKYLDLMKWSERHYDLAVNMLIKKDYSRSSEYFSINNLKKLLQNRGLYNHYSFVSRYFSSQILRAVFTFQDSYISLNPYKSPSIYSLFPYSELTHGSFLPEGGMHQVIKALETIALKNRVSISYNTPIKRIVIEDNRAAGVETSRGALRKADLIIANAELPYVYSELLPDSRAAKKLRRKKYSCSVLTFHWGIRTKYDKLATHNLFFANSYKEGFGSVLESAVPPQDPQFYVQAPARTDPSRAPRGRDTLTVMVPINNLAICPTFDWEKYRNDVRKYVIARLERAGLTDLEKQILFEYSHLQKDWENHLNLPYGAVCGLDHNLFQLGYLRPQRRHEKYTNLYFVGASTHPGSGLPTVLQSSLFTARQILAQET